MTSPVAPTTVVFISASYLVKEYNDFPPEVMATSIFFFGSKRSWVFPANEEEVKDSKRQPTKYLDFPEPFKAIILEKEQNGLVYWLKPKCDFNDVSRFFTQLGFNPLQLDKTWWKTKFDKKTAKFTHNVDRIIVNYSCGEHDYNPVMELLYQSDPRLQPMLKRDVLELEKLKPALPPTMQKVPDGNALHSAEPVTVFISASALVREYREVPTEVLDRSIFFFGSNRAWVFPTTPDEVEDSKRQPTAYLEFPEDFKAMILEKERHGKVCWLKPDSDYTKVSEFFEALGYAPLQLDPQWWLREFNASKAEHCRSAKSIVDNFQSGEHDYGPVMELVHQSNLGKLVPKLCWKNFYY